MALRFRYRHVHATLFAYVRTQLVELGWGDSALAPTDSANTNINFDTLAMTFHDFQPDEAGMAVAGQTVAITMGDEPASEDQELGAGLALIRYPVYIDVYGANQALATAVTSDLKDILEDLYLPVLDYTANPPATTDELIEIWHEDVMSGRPTASLAAQDFKRYWRTLHLTARVDYLR